VLRQEPHAVGQIREVGRAVVVELHVVGIVPHTTDAVVVVALETLVDDVYGAVDVRLVGDDLGHFLRLAMTSMN
jgi:hypothetical protein